jgi:hypothetical protein
MEREGISDSLRQAIAGSGLSLAAVSAVSGVPLASVRRFVLEGKDLRLTTAVALAKGVGFAFQLKRTVRRR